MNDRIIEKIETILIQLGRVESKLDAIIDALHDYDEGTSHCEYSGLPSVKSYDEPKQAPCSKHDAASWDEEEAERRMDIIGQNGNEGLHYDNETEHEHNMLTSPSYREWWEQNKERILEKDVMEKIERIKQIDKEISDRQARIADMLINNKI